MATEFKRYIHVADTTTVLTTANDLMVKGELWFDVTLGKFKIAPADGNYNSQSFYIHAWGDISGKPTSYPSTIADVTGLTSALAGKSDTGHTHAWADITSKPSTFTPSTHTHAQADITGLVSDLAGKAASTHTHAQSDVTGLVSALAGKASTTHTHAASDITSGTVDPARLPLATTSAFGVIKVGAGLAVSSGVLSVIGGSGADRGELFDVRGYGALTGYANETATTQAFQDCMDAIRTAGGGTMYIPATGVADSYFLRRPIWCGVENITVMGEGSNASTLTGYGPCFITAKHPTQWDCAVTSYTDVDTSATVTVKTGGIVTNRERYRMDLTEFMSGGTYPPGGGRPALGVSTGAGYFGLRTRRNVMGGRYPQASLASGENNGGSNFFTQWSHYDKIEWNFIFYQHETTLVGAIAGAGSLQRPDPWILWGDGTDYILDLALTDSDGIRRTWIRCKFAQSASVGIHRITIQFDPANATDANRIRASVDRTRVAVARYNFSDATNSYHAMNTWNSSGNFADLWDVWNRVGNWHGSDFTICNESSKVGSKDNLEISSGFTDYTVLLVSAFKDFKHDLGSIGATITKVGGAAADDSFVWPYTSGADSDTTAIGWMANETYNSWSPASTIDDVNLMAFGKGRSKCWGYMHPKGGGDAMTATVKNQLYRGFATQSRDNHQNSCGMLVGAVLNVNIEDVHFKNGYYWSLAFMRQRVCYPLRIRNVRFSKGVHLSDCSIWGEDWVFDYARNCAILGTGAELVLKDLYGLSFDALATGIIRWHAGESIAAGLDIQKANFNIEGDGIWGQNGPCVYYQKAYNHPGNRVILRDVSFGEPAGPAIYIDDTVPNSTSTVKVDCERIGIGNGGTALTARGKDVLGQVKIDPHVYMGEVNEYLNTYGSGNTNPQYASVKTIDDLSYGLPPCGSFVDRMHEVRVKRPAEGCPQVWTPTSTGIQNHSMPSWVPSDFSGSAYQHAMSATFTPSLYCEATIPWPTASTTVIPISGPSIGMARSMLATLLTGATAPDRATMSLRWGVNYVSHISTGLVDGQFFAADGLTNSSYWASAGASAQREKRTNADITIAGGDAPAWTVKVRRRWSFGLHLGTAKTLFIAGRTPKMEPSSWTGMGTSSYTLASGNLRVGMRSYSAGFVNSIANQILDWMMGGSFPSGITSTLYFALSTTNVSSSVTEPGSGSYARVSLARNSTNFGETGDSGYIWSNKVSITFPAPTADWGLIQGVAIYDASTSGNLIAAVNLNRPIRVYNGDQAPVFRPGALQFCL